MHRSRSSSIPYTPLNIVENDSTLFDSELSVRDVISHSGPLPSNFGRQFFLISCAIALIISAFNSAFLATSNSYQSFAKSKPRHTPSVYMGLENLQPDTSVCRSRMTFPKHFATFRGDDVLDMTQVHAPGDKVMLSFGGEVCRLYILYQQNRRLTYLQVSAHIDYYVPDYGLENCTITIKSIADPYTLNHANSSIEIWRLSGSSSLSGKVLLGTLTHSASTTMESTTDPFYCPSRSHMYFQWRCPQEDCRVNFPLEGVTTMSKQIAILCRRIEQLMSSGLQLLRPSP